MLRMLDVVIGVVLLFALISVLCSAATEIVEALLRRRAADLEAGIKRLLHDQGLVDKFYEHGLVKILTKERPGKDGKLLSARPSYIPARSAALALLEVLSPTLDRSSLPAMAQGLRQDVPAGQALRSVLAAASGDFHAGIQAMERWFDSAMDGVSSAYKRRTQRFLLVIGGVVVVAMNADAVNVATSLAIDPDLRARAVASAIDAVKPAAKLASSPGPAATPEPNARALPAAPAVPEVGASPAPGGQDIRLVASAPVGGAPGQGGGTSPGAGAAPRSDSSSTTSTSAVTSAALEALTASTLPVGWVARSIREDRRGYPDGPLPMLTKIVGLLITTLAVSLGAPFWFDLLNRLVQIRASVKPEDAEKRRARSRATGA